MEVFELSETQTNYILEMPLRRLTRFSRIELETERDKLEATIAELTEILDNPEQLRTLVGNQLAEIAQQHGTPRRTILLAASGVAATAARCSAGGRGRSVLGAALLRRPARPDQPRAATTAGGYPCQPRPHRVQDHFDGTRRLRTDHQRRHG